MDSIRQNYTNIKHRIEKAADSVGQDPAQIKLIVVTKAHPLETAKTAVEAGANILGENYVQEALPKIKALSNLDVEWHMIGHVQSRKARDVAQNFSWMHTLDSLKLARRLNQFAGEVGRQLPVLLECNISAEATKHGWPVWEEQAWPELAENVAAMLEYPNLEFRGLMTMPPFEPEPELARPYFVKLRKLRDYLDSKMSDQKWDHLSMGMSNDFEVAIQEGATFVRVGTAIVGSRSYGTIE